MIDTCVGDHKHRPDTPAWHMKDGRFLDELTRMGVPPESVDFVMCTHLHVDHVGWNTRLEDGRWVPTFPNAKYLFHEDEYTHWEVTDMPEGAGNTRRDVFEDSVLPVVEAGQAIMVSDGHRIDDALHINRHPAIPRSRFPPRRARRFHGRLYTTPSRSSIPDATADIATIPRNLPQHAARSSNAAPIPTRSSWPRISWTP